MGIKFKSKVTPYRKWQGEDARKNLLENFSSSSSDIDRILSHLKRINTVDTGYSNLVEYAAKKNLDNMFVKAYEWPTRGKGTKGIKVDDIRGMEEATGIPLTDFNKLHAIMDPQTTKYIIEEAQKRDIDPYIPLSIGLAESGMRPVNPLQYNNLFSIISALPTKKKAVLTERDLIGISLDFLKSEMARARKMGKMTPEEIIQVWNGYGPLTAKNSPLNRIFGTGSDINKYYGIDVSKNPIRMNENPVYGKRVMDLYKNVLMKQYPNIDSLLSEIGRLQTDSAK